MKLNATLLFQIGNFLILHWILKRFFLKKILSFLFESRNSIKQLHIDEENLVKEKTSLIEERQNLINQFKQDIAKKEELISTSYRKKEQVKAIIFDKVETTESSEDLTEKLVEFIKKESLRES
ncbi:hypothetical protein COB28_00985 [Candidatus Dependentiae bacterium]|nr:MAG: hypothetical protein COB28_00985 [Candidatus Dependentiae bacterium]